MSGIEFTRGRLTAAWHILRTLEKLGGRIEPEELVRYALTSSMRAGGLPIETGLKIALASDFLVEVEGILALRPLGTRALSLCSEDEPTLEVLRLLVSTAMLRDPPAWVAWWQGRPEDREAVIPVAEQALLEDVGLLPPPDPGDPASWAWWQALDRIPLAHHDSAERKRLGHAGESLTVDWERHRLTAQGHAGLADDIRWVAEESEAYGFDVLSFAGDDYYPLAADTPLAIEVKSSARPSRGRFAFYLSAHEWHVAGVVGESYIFHLWESVESGPPPASRATGPGVIRAADLAKHLPGMPECGERCAWHTAWLELPFPS